MKCAEDENTNRFDNDDPIFHTPTRQNGHLGNDLGRNSHSTPKSQAVESARQRLILSEVGGFFSSVCVCAFQNCFYYTLNYMIVICQTEALFFFLNQTSIV